MSGNRPLGLISTILIDRQDSVTLSIKSNEQAELSMCQHLLWCRLLASRFPRRSPRLPLAVGVLRFAPQADPEESGLLALRYDKLLPSGNDVGQGFTHLSFIPTAALQAQTPSRGYHVDIDWHLVLLK